MEQAIIGNKNKRWYSVLVLAGIILILTSIPLLQAKEIHANIWEMYQKFLFT